MCKDNTKAESSRIKTEIFSKNEKAQNHSYESRYSNFGTGVSIPVFVKIGVYIPLR